MLDSVRRHSPEGPLSSGPFFYVNTDNKILLGISIVLRIKLSLWCQSDRFTTGGRYESDVNVEN